MVLEHYKKKKLVMSPCLGLTNALIAAISDLNLRTASHGSFQTWTANTAHLKSGRYSKRDLLNVKACIVKS